MASSMTSLSSSLTSSMGSLSSSMASSMTSLSSSLTGSMGGLSSSMASSMTTLSSSLTSSMGSLSSSMATSMNDLSSSMGSIMATTGSNLFKGDQTISGSIIPAVNGLYDLGSITNEFRDLYLSSASLYIDGTKVLGSTTQELTITTDTGQSFKILEAGSDTITLQAADGNITFATSGGGDVILDPTSGVIALKGTTTLYAGNKILSSDGNAIQIGNSVTMTGSLIVTGFIETQELRTTYISSSILYRSGSTKFGDELTDTHSFTGSLSVSGSISIPESGLVSGSSQITYSGLSGVPSGIISGSAQLPSGLVSGSSQILNGSGIWSGSAQLPSGIVSSSAQTIANLPSGVVSGSAQTIANLPSGTVSGSVQVSFTGTTGYSTYINQAVLTSSSPTFNGLTNNSTYSQTTTSTQPVMIYGDSAGSNGLFRIQIDEVNDSFGTGARTFLGDGGIDIFLGTSNSSYTPGNTYIALNHGGEISMGAGSATKHLILSSTGAVTLSNSLTVATTGTFGFQDYRTQDTQKVLVLNAEGVSGQYAPSLFNIYTKPGTTSNGIASIIIKSKYSTEAESGNLFEFKGDGSAIFSSSVTANGGATITGGNFNISVSNSATYATIQMSNNASKDFQQFVFGSGRGDVYFGQAAANWAVQYTTSANGLMTGTYNNTSYIIGTNNTARLTFTNSGDATFNSNLIVATNQTFSMSAYQGSRFVRLFKSFDANNTDTWCRIYLPSSYSDVSNGVFGIITVGFLPIHASRNRWFQYRFFQGPYSANNSSLMAIDTVFVKEMGWDYYSYSADVNFYNYQSYLYIKVTGRYSVSYVRTICAELQGGDVGLAAVTLEVDVAAPAGLSGLITKGGADMTSG